MVEWSTSDQSRDRVRPCRSVCPAELVGRPGRPRPVTVPGRSMSVPADRTAVRVRVRPYRRDVVSLSCPSVRAVVTSSRGRVRPYVRPCRRPVVVSVRTCRRVVVVVVRVRVRPRTSNGKGLELAFLRFCAQCVHTYKAA